MSVKYRERAVFMVVVLFFSTLFLAIGADVDGSEDVDLPRIQGSVVNKETLLGYRNFTIIFERENLIPVSVVTNLTGGYNTTLPPGLYTVKVYTSGGIWSGQLVDQRRINITWDPIVIFDILIDTGNLIRSHVHGHVIDEDWEEPLGNCEVRLINIHALNTNSTRTNDNGSYSIFAYPGEYFLTVHYEGKERYNKTIHLEWGKDRKSNISIEGKGDRPLVTLEDIRGFLEDHWKDILGLLVIIFVIIFLYLIFTMVLNFIKKKLKLLEADWFIAIQHFLNRMSILLAVILISYQLSKMFVPVEDYVWIWMSNVAGPFIGILVMLLVSRILLLGNSRLWDYIRKKRSEGGKKILPVQIISMLEIILRYLILIVSAAVIFILVLYAFGLRQEISARASNFLSDNAGKLSFLVILVVITILLKRFIDIFFKELGTRSLKVSPQIMTMTHKGSVGIVFFVISLIFLFTLLSIGGLGDIGESLILVISMIVGLVVSFAATGSIGNLLSGVVLMSMRPYNVNDRVEISGVIGDITAIGIMFTTLRDLDGKLHEIPNNNVLMGTITNYTRSVEGGGLAVVVDVSLGYDINPKTARALMKRAALTSPGVLKDKTPRVIVRRFLDSSVEYRLRAYIDDPSNMLHIRSSVMESMLYAFHTEGLEILSPNFHVKREGRPPTSEELDCRTKIEARENGKEEAAGGLTMFDDLTEK